MRTIADSLEHFSDMLSRFNVDVRSTIKTKAIDISQDQWKLLMCAIVSDLALHNSFKIRGLGTFQCHLNPPKIHKGGTFDGHKTGWKVKVRFSPDPLLLEVLLDAMAYKQNISIEENSYRERRVRGYKNETK